MREPEFAARQRRGGVSPAGAVSGCGRRAGGVIVRTAGARLMMPYPPSRLLPAVTISLPVTVFGITALSVPLALAAALKLSAAATADWIAALYGLSAICSVGLVLWYRQPLLVAWSISGTALAATLVGQASYAELRGAVLVAG